MSRDAVYRAPVLLVNLPLSCCCFTKAIYIRLFCDYETHLLTLNPGGLMRPGYPYTEMCQRALKQALPQANVTFPQVRQAVWPNEICQAIC